MKVTGRADSGSPYDGAEQRVQRCACEQERYSEIRRVTHGYILPHDSTVQSPDASNREESAHQSNSGVSHSVSPYSMEQSPRRDNGVSLYHYVLSRTLLVL